MPTSTQADPIRVFADVARSFVALMTKGEQLEANLLYRELIALQSAAIELPIGNPSIENPPSNDYMVDYMVDYNTRRELVSLCLPSNLGYYHECLEPLQIYSDPQMGMGDAVDDLADILGDLERGLAVLENCGAEAAAWSWQFSFKSHWRSHAIGLLAALVGLL